MITNNYILRRLECQQLNCQIDQVLANDKAESFTFFIFDLSYFTVTSVQSSKTSSSMLPKSPSLNWTTESVDLSGPCDNTDIESDMIDLFMCFVYSSSGLTGWIWGTADEINLYNFLFFVKKIPQVLLFLVVSLCFKQLSSQFSFTKY